MSDGELESANGGSAVSADGSEGWRRVQRARSLDPSEQEEAEVDNATARFEQLEVGGRILDIFDDHCNHMQRLASARQALLGLRLVTHQDGTQTTDGASAGECVSFVRLPSDRFVGDARLRCVRALLAEIDERGFERFVFPSSFTHILTPCARRLLFPHSMAQRTNGTTITATTECACVARGYTTDLITRSASTTPSFAHVGVYSTAKSGRCTARPL